MKYIDSDSEWGNVHTCPSPDLNPGRSERQQAVNGNNTLDHLVIGAGPHACEAI